MKIIHMFAIAGLAFAGTVTTQAVAAPVVTTSVSVAAATVTETAQDYRRGDRYDRGERRYDRGERRYDRRERRYNRGRSYNRGRYYRPRQRCWTERRYGGRRVTVCRRR